MNKTGGCVWWEGHCAQSWILEECLSSKHGKVNMHHQVGYIVEGLLRTWPDTRFHLECLGTRQLEQPRATGWTSSNYKVGWLLPCVFSRPSTVLETMKSSTGDATSFYWITFDYFTFLPFSLHFLHLSYSSFMWTYLFFSKPCVC